MRFLAVLSIICMLLITPACSGIVHPQHSQLKKQHTELVAQIQKQKTAIQELPKELHRQMHVGFQVQQLAKQMNPQTEDELIEFGKQVVKIVQKVEHERSMEARELWFESNWIFLGIFSLFMLCFPCIYVRTVLYVKSKRRSNKKLS